tara:strand:+ start:536 stop:1066 length:531 start_codon:yes stop_codon:yes gene_type:complete
MTVTFFADGRILHNGVEVASEKMVDFWYISSDISNSDSDSYLPGSKFTRNNRNAGASQIGTGMSVASDGTWTFPTTGKYMIDIHINNRANSGDNTYLGLFSTTNNSTYIECKRVQSSSSGNSGNAHSGSGSYFIDVTDTSQVKVKYYPMSLQSGSIFEGADTTQLQSTITYTRLSR